MLPKYRRLVETLAQAGLLKVICGTDTLGVGINVPIRTVLFTALTKYDGVRTPAAARRASSTRSPAGPDGPGSTRRARSSCRPPSTSSRTRGCWPRPATTPKKRRKVVRKKPPEGFVAGARPTFERLVDAEPEPLTVQLRGDPRDGAQRHRPARRRLRRDAPPADGQPRGPRRPARGTSGGPIAIYRALLRGGRRRAAADARPGGPAGPARRRPAARLRAQPAAVAVRAGRARAARPRVADYAARRRVGDRGDAGRPARRCCPRSRTRPAARPSRR